jgi:REP element-mobilizing transposase RayT
VTHDRLPVFRTDALKQIVCAALDEARQSGGFAILAYVIMPDHLQVITNGPLKPSDTLRFLNGISSHRVIGYLHEGNYTSSLAKLRDMPKARGQAYSLWDGHYRPCPSTARASSCSGSITFLRIPCERGWWSERRIMVGPVFDAGTVGGARMNPCCRTCIRSSDANHDEGPARHSLAG